MLIIRDEQLAALSEHSRRGFEDRAYEHLCKCWVRQCERFGEQAVRSFISYAIDKAGSYGVTTEKGVIRFLDTMFALGDQFDNDPELPWFLEILKDPEMPQNIKMDRIWSETKRIIKIGSPDKRG